MPARANEQEGENLVNNYYIHHTTRRLRVRIPALKANAKVAQELQAAMLELTGVASVEINLLTGSVLVHHDGERSTLERVCGFMERRGLWPAADRTATKVGNSCSLCAPALQPASRIGGNRPPGEKVAEAVVKHLLDGVLERLIASTLIGLL
jgi:hypothetical protein